MFAYPPPVIEYIKSKYPRQFNTCRNSDWWIITDGGQWHDFRDVGRPLWLDTTGFRFNFGPSTKQYYEPAIQRYRGHPVLGGFKCEKMSRGDQIRWYAKQTPASFFRIFDALITA